LEGGIMVTHTHVESTYNLNGTGFAKWHFGQASPIQILHENHVHWTILRVMRLKIWVDDSKTNVKVEFGIFGMGS
jgi:hypothetical protein